MLFHRDIIKSRSSPRSNVLLQAVILVELAKKQAQA